jgi:hypothetical protein
VAIESSVRFSFQAKPGQLTGRNTVGGNAGEFLVHWLRACRQSTVDPMETFLSTAGSGADYGLTKPRNVNHIEHAGSFRALRDDSYSPAVPDRHGDGLLLFGLSGRGYSIQNTVADNQGSDGPRQA